MADRPSIGEPFNPREKIPAMEGFTVPFALAQCEDVSHAAKLFYGHLRWRAGKGNDCFPSQRDIAHAIGLTDLRTIRRVQSELIEKGFIRVHKRFDDTGRRTTNHFEFLYHPSFEAQAIDDAQKAADKGGVQGKIALYPQGENAQETRAETPGTYRTKMSGHETTTMNHHHETQNRSLKSVQHSTPAEPARTAAEAEANADLVSSLIVDDDSRSRGREQMWATAKDEVKAIYLEKAGEPITIYALDAIEHNLSTNGATLDQFIIELRKHKQGRWNNPAGFIRDLAKKFKRKTAVASKPLTTREVADANYRCEKCDSRTRGEGARLVNKQFVPCDCASPEWIARQVERHVFKG